MNLTSQQKDAFRKLLKEIDTTQSEVARAAKMTPAHVSEILREAEEGRPEKGISETRWRTLLEVVYAELQKKEPELLSQNRHAYARQLFDALDLASAAPMRGIHDPGEPLGPEATNYVERSSDTAVFATLPHQTFSLAFIHGGVQFGASSLHRRVVAAVRQRNHALHVVDGLDIEPAGGSSTREPRAWGPRELLRQVLRGLGVSADEPPRREVTLHDWAMASLETWGQKNWRHHDRAFIAFDNMDALADAATHEALVELFNLFAHLRRRNATDPFRRLTTLLFGGPLATDAAFTSGTPTQGRVIVLPRFTCEEVEMLAERLDVRLPREAVEKVHGYFDGHPHLIHVALATVRAGATIDDELARAKRLVPDSEYHRHWRRVRRTILRHLESGGGRNERKFLQRIAQLAMVAGHAGPRTRSALSTTSNDLSREEITYLQRTGLLRFGEEGALMSSFYTDAIGVDG